MAERGGSGIPGPVAVLRSIAIPPGLTCLLAAGVLVSYRSTGCLHCCEPADPEGSQFLAKCGDLAEGVRAMLLGSAMGVGVLSWLGWRSWRRSTWADRRRGLSDGAWLIAAAGLLVLPMIYSIGMQRHQWALGLGAVALLVLGWWNWDARPPRVRRGAWWADAWLAALLVVFSYPPAGLKKLRAAQAWDAREQEAVAFWETQGETLAAQGLPGVPDNFRSAMLANCDECFVPDAGPAAPALLQALEARLAQEPMQYQYPFVAYYMPQLIVRGAGLGTVLVLRTSQSSQEFIVFLPANAEPEGRYTFPDEATLVAQSDGSGARAGGESLIARLGWTQGIADSGWIEVHPEAEDKLVVTVATEVRARAYAYQGFRLTPTVQTHIEWAPWHAAPYALFWASRPTYKESSLTPHGRWTLDRATEREMLPWGYLLRKENVIRQRAIARSKGQFPWVW